MLGGRAVSRLRAGWWAGLSTARAVTAAAVAVAVAAAAVVVAVVATSGGGAGDGPAARAAVQDGINGTLPPVGHPQRGGTITVGQVAGQVPVDIFPLPGQSSCTTPTLNFIQAQYIPLYAGPQGARPAINERLSAAEPPVYSDGDRTVTITLKRGLRWSDGAPVNASDVIFYIDLLKAALSISALNWCQYSAGGFPANVASVSARGARTVVLRLRQAVNPGWFTSNQLQDMGAGVYPLPSQAWNVDSPNGPHVTDWATSSAAAQRIYDYLSAQGRDPASFTSDPLWRVVDGPFRLHSFDASSGAYELVPNARYGLRPRARVRAVAVRTYRNPGAVLAALRAGRLEIAALDPSTQIAAIAGLRRRGFSVFGGPGWGWFGAVINFQDASNDFKAVIAQGYIRGALAQLVDQGQIISRVYHGWAVAAYGPVPSAPRSPYLATAAAAPPWPYDPARAVASLKAHGWRVRPGGRTTCARPGSGPHDCGAGIPSGTPISFTWANLASSVSPVGIRESRIFAAAARRYAGVDIRFLTGSFSTLTADYNDQNPAARAYINDWGMNNFGGALTDYYPTQEGLLGTGGSLNLGGYSSGRAQRLMAASISQPGDGAINREAAYFSHALPILYLPDQDWIMAVSAKVGGPAAAFMAMTQQQYQFQLLYSLGHG